MIAGRKAAIVLELMKRKEGATLAEIAKATDWQNHSIRGFVSGHVTKMRHTGTPKKPGETPRRPCLKRLSFSVLGFRDDIGPH
jgi:hypothetical protein